MSFNKYYMQILFNVHVVHIANQQIMDKTIHKYDFEVFDYDNN